MKRVVSTLLMLGLAAVLLVCLTTAAFAQYSLVSVIKYPGVETDRGLAVNKNVGSPYYGYLYACDGTAGARIVRVLQPDPVGAGTDATAYVPVGTIGHDNTPGNNLLNNVFVGSDDTVWVPDYHAKTVCTGPPEGGNLTVQFTTAQAPRSVWVVGALGAAGTRAYVAESSWASPAFIEGCEVFEYDGAQWTRIADVTGIVTATGTKNIFTVAVDDDGNSYWMGNKVNQPYLIKVKPDFTLDESFEFVKPGFLASGWISNAVTFVSDPENAANPGFLYVTGGGSWCTMRLDLDGNYLDGFGTTWDLAGTPPAGTWTPFEVVNPGTNQIIWLTSDDKHNVYIVTKVYNAQAGVYEPCVKKVHLPFMPNPPGDMALSHDIYGQIKATWEPATPKEPLGQVGKYHIYRSTDTTKPADKYATILDAYPKWKDAEQGIDPGGPFYYWVSASNFGGETQAVGPFGPIAPSTSTAPAPRSKNVAFSLSEVTQKDVGEVWNFDDLIVMARSFLDDRGVDYTVVYDADATKLNIENDDLAGHTLLIQPANRDMTSYTAQCIRDYWKYSGGRLFTGYWNSEANDKFVGYSNFQLADVYRVNKAGWTMDSATDTHPWWYLRFRYVKPEIGIPGADTLFDGLPDGVAQPGKNVITMLATPYTDGTAEIVGKWYGGDGVTLPYTGNDPRNAACIIGYKDAEPRSIYTHLLWWYRTAEAGWGGTFSATRFTENILNFFGVSFTPQLVGSNMGGSKIANGDGSSVAYSDVVVTQELNDYLHSKNNIYVQTQDRSSGIKVFLPPTLTPIIQSGSLVHVSGFLDSEFEQLTPGGPKTWGDRVLNALEVFPLGTADVPEPMYMLNKNVVGAWSSNWYQQGAWVGNGVNNLGLYVKVSGKLTHIEYDYMGSVAYFYIDDGSGLVDGSTHLDASELQVANNGLRVVCPLWNFPYPPAGFDIGKHVSVSGCTALELVGLGGDNGIPAIRIANMDQIAVHD